MYELYQKTNCEPTQKKANEFIQINKEKVKIFQFCCIYSLVIYTSELVFKLFLEKLTEIAC